MYKKIAKGVLIYIETYSYIKKKHASKSIWPIMCEINFENLNPKMSLEVTLWYVCTSQLGSDIVPSNSQMINETVILDHNNLGVGKGR